MTYLYSANQTVQDLADVASVLHGDDTQVIFLVDPDQKCLIVVVIDTASLNGNYNTELILKTNLRPIIACISVLQEAIALLEQEVV